jgi:hypothetical protein
MDRRSMLWGVIGAAATGGIRPALAGGIDPEAALREEVAALWSRWEEIARQTLHRLGWSAQQPVPEPVRIYAEHTAAMACMESLSRMDPADQTHPAVQGLIETILMALGRGSRQLRQTLERVAAMPEEPPASLLNPLMEHGLMSLSSAPVSERSWRLNHSGSVRLRDDIARVGLRGVARRQARRLARAEALAMRIAAADGDTSVLSHADARLKERVRVGQQRWGVSEKPSPARKALLILGLIVSGLVVIYSGLLIIFSIVCTFSCSAEALVGVLIGGLVFTAALWSSLRIVHRLRPPASEPIDSEEGLWELDDVPEDAPPPTWDEE